MIKKMLAMLVAISCAFGAWADTHISGTDFSGLSAGPFVLNRDDSGQATDSTFWYNGAPSDFEGTIVTDGVGKFLDFESNITNPLYRTINNCYEAESISELPKRAIGTGLFIDTHVQFTPYLVNENHPAPEALSTDDKLIVWVRETEVDGNANITNLIVTAGYYDAFNAVSASNYVVRLSSDKVSELCSNTNRLTIKSFSCITDKANGPVGFVIYLNERPIEYDADAFAVGCTYVDDLAATPGSYYEYGHHMLFPSLMGDLANYDKLIGVGYAGMGKIGDVIFDDKTTDFPPFAADANDFRIVPGDGVESYVYNNVEYTTEQAFSVPATVATVTISNVQYATGWQHKEGTWYNGTTIVANEYDAVTDTDYGTFVLANGATLNIAGFQANYTVGGEPYQTLFGGSVTEPTGAFAAAKNGGTIVLNSDIIIAEGVNEQIVVGEGDELTIDLNGHTIQGTAADGTIVNEGGTLTIVDNSVGQTGKVLGCLVANPDYDSEDPDSEPLIDNEQALLITEDAVATTLDAGTYEFITKDELNNSLVISNGAYLCVNEYNPGEQPTSFYLVGSLADGATYIWSQDTDTSLWYAIVTSGSAPTTYAVTFSTNSVTVAEYTTNITAGATLPDAAIPAFTGGAWDVDPTNAVINAATNFNYTISGPADPWAPTAETDEAAAAKIADLFPGTEVAANVTTYAMYTNLVDYIKGVTSQSEVPGGITDAQQPWLWKSYILGANPLFVTNAVVAITDVNAAATVGEWDFIVKVTEGELTTAHSVAAAKVAALVKVTDSLSPASWSAPDPEDVHADLEPLLGTNLIKVTVDFGTDTSGFMKVSE